MLLKAIAPLLTLTIGLSACQSSPPPASDNPLQDRQRANATAPSTAEVRDIARQAYFYGFPIVEAYKTLYAQAVDRQSSDYKAPFNRIGHTARIFTPDDKAFITPNADTPYSFAWLDLRAEPVVLTLPPIKAQRYYSVQLIDIYTHNFAYLGTRTTGNAGGNYMIVGPDWHGETPAHVQRVIRSESNIVYALYRTQLLNDGDIDRVRGIQRGYAVQTLSAFTGSAPPRPAPPIAWPAPGAAMTDSADLFRYLNFMLQFAPTHPSERALMARFRTVGIGPGLPFDVNRLDAATRQAMNDGIAQGRAQFDAFRQAQRQSGTGRVTSADVFGSREHLRNNYLYRYAGAKLGIFGNSAEESIYQGYYVDAAGSPLDASTRRYALRFAPGALPPANAFWSVTMYDGKTRMLASNPIRRYLINSTMLDSLQRDADGGITLNLQKEPVAQSRRANWLPAPDGPFYIVLRLYLPGAEAVSGEWRAPALEAVALRKP